MGRLAGKSAIITGAAGGLGAEMARGCAREGAKVLIADIQEDAGRSLAAELNAAGAEAAFERLDVTDEEQWVHVVDVAQQAFGPLNVLVNNAGIVLEKAPIEKTSAEAWDRLMAINLKGVFLGTKHAIPAMRAAGGGSIVNISSIAGIGQSQHQEPAYAASKGAVRLFSKVAATQHAHENIRCNSLHPGPTDGGMLLRFLADPEAMARRLARVPMGRLGTMDEIVAGVVFLASDESSFMTGAELVIDGGCLAQ